MVPLANHQPKLYLPLNDCLGNVNGSVLRIGGYGDFNNIKKFFDSVKYGRDRVSRMVRRLLDNILALKEFMWYQLPIYVFEVSENVRNIVVGIFCRDISDIHEIFLLNCGDNLLEKGLLGSCHFAKNMHFLGIFDSHV